MAFFDDVKKGITDVSETIVKQSTKLVEIQKLKMKKTSLEGDIKRDFALLGKLYFAKMEADGTEGETPEAFQSYERIISARQAVSEIKAKLSKMKNEKNCRACGAGVPLDTIYCPRCGTRFEAEDTAEEGEAEAAEAVKAEAESEAKAEGEAEAKTEVKAEHEAEAETENEAKAEHEAEAKTEAETETESEETVK